MDTSAALFEKLGFRGPQSRGVNRIGDQTQTAADLQTEWAADPRWSNVRRDYTAEDVVALRGPGAASSTVSVSGGSSSFRVIARSGWALSSS